jgi:hypothetical protein
MTKRNDSERRDWINNDEGLYDWARSWRARNRGNMRDFIRANRTEIDECIDRVLNGDKPAHYLKYGG